MSEHAEHRPKPPRFPYVAAALCAACVGAAAWSWMRYSYRLDVTPRMFHQGKVPDRAYIRLRGKLVYFQHPSQPNKNVLTHAARYVRWVEHTSKPDDAAIFPGDPCLGVYVSEEHQGTDYFVAIMGGVRWDEFTDHVCWEGRAEVNSPAEFGRIVFAYMRRGASRLHGASIAGLVVGAMGVFVFAVALRHWLGERRALR